MTESREANKSLMLKLDGIETENRKLKQLLFDRINSIDAVIIRKCKSVKKELRDVNSRIDALLTSNVPTKKQ